MPGLTPSETGYAALLPRVVETERLSAAEDRRCPQVARETVALAQQLGQPDLEVRARLALAWHVLEQDPELSEHQVQAASALAGPLADPALQAQVHCLEARLAIRQGDAPKVLRLAHLAQEAARTAGQVAPLVHAFSLMGVAYQLVGEAAQALVYQAEVLGRLDQVDSPSLLTCLLCDVGANHNDFGTPEDARGFLERAHQIAERHDLRFSKILVRENLGRTLLHLGLVEAGERLVHEGLEQALREGYPRWEAYLRCTLGEYQLKRGELDSGHRQLARAVAVSEAVQDAYLSSTARLTLAGALRQLGQLPQARALLEQAVQDALAADLLAPSKTAHLALSEVCAEQGLYREALAHHQHFHALAIRVQVEESRRQAQLLVLQRDLDLERQQAEDQRRLNQELLQVNVRVQQQAEELGQAARQDFLTGLANHRSFSERLRAHLDSGEDFSLVLFDIDHFKRVNDRHGHPTGDEVLRRLGQVLLRQIRAADFGARVGGEEFALLLNHAGHEFALEVAERVRLAVARHPWQELDLGAPITVSLGVAHSSEAAHAAGLLALADRRLYQAKHLGRDRVV